MDNTVLGSAQGIALSRRAFVGGALATSLMAGLPLFTGCAPQQLAARVRVLIIGGGAAGLPVAACLRRLLPNATLTLVDPAEWHYYQPGFTFIGAGIWSGDDVGRKQANLIPEGVTWIQEAVVALDPDKKVATLTDGAHYVYDFLVLCPGLQENWSGIEGISRENLGVGNAHSIYDFTGAARTWAAIDKWTRSGGRGVFTDTWTKLKCGGAPKKICLLAEHLARKRGTRQQLSFNYFTASKQLYDVPHYTPRLLAIYKEHDIPIRLRAKLTGVDTAKKRAYFVDRDTHAKFTEDYDFLHFAPPQSAPDFVRNSGLSWTEGKLAPEGWVAVDKETLVHLKYPNVVCLGDVAGIPTSKTSAAIRKQYPIAVANLCALIAGKAPAARYDGYAACPIITDYGHVLMAEFDYAKKPVPSFPFNLMDTRRELTSAWLLKKYVLKPLYFNLMLRGLA